MSPRVHFCSLLLLAFSISAINSCHPANNTCTDAEDLPHLLRAKRWLHFIPYGGVAKIVVNFVGPVKFNHKVVRSLNSAVGLQANYAIPGKIIWPHPESYFKERFLQDGYEDTSRVQLYRTLERIVDSWGGNGRGCLLRAICETAETPLGHNGLIGEILDVVFSPSQNDKLSQEYAAARSHGQDGLGCSQFYDLCPVGSGVLDKISALYDITK